MVHRRTVRFHSLALAASLALLPLLVAGCGDLSTGEAAPSSGPPPQTVANVNPQRLLGLWYENASIPAQGDRLRTAAVLSIGPAGGNNLALSYRWHESTIDGPSHEVAATATPTDASNAKFRLHPSPAPLPSHLWVLALASDNSIVALGSPDRKALFILSRQPTIFANTFGELVRALQAQAYPTDRLQLTTQTPSAQ
jgi:apolipoprotein D and lipocalin family protein